MRSLRIATGLLALFGMACAGRQAAFEVSNEIQGETPAAARFAIFGPAEADGLFRALIVASDDRALCDRVAPGFSADLAAGQVAGTLVAISVASDAPLAAGRRLDGADLATDVAASFLVSNGTELFVNAKDTTAAGALTVDALEGDLLSATLSATLDVDEANFFDSSLSVALDGAVIAAVRCEALSADLAAGLVVEEPPAEEEEED
jgi:hypothetical protein